MFNSIFSQSQQDIVGHWELEKIGFRKTESSTKESMLKLYQSALLQTLTNEQQQDLDELNLINVKAEEMGNIYYQSKIEFQSNGAFYNTSEKTISGEYLIDDKKLLLDWETADKNSYKILKTTDSELVLKDKDLKIYFHYSKIID